MKIDFEEFWKEYPADDEIVFYFESEGIDIVHYVGYLEEYDKPYWAGLCDIENGTDFKTLDELLNAKIYAGKSLKDRWNEVVILEVNGVPIEMLW